MIKVNLVNAQVATERIIKSLERGEETLARSQLNNIKRNAYNKLYYAEKRYEETMPTGIEYQIQRAQIKQAQVEKAQIDNAVNTIREYIKNPEQFTFKTERANYFKLQKAFQRINFVEEKKAAERETVREAQREAGSVSGVTLLNIRKSNKMSALFENVLYNNMQFDFNKAELEKLAARIRAITGYNVLEKFYNHFDTPQHYESGGSPSQKEGIFDAVTNIAGDLKNMLTSYQNDPQYADLEDEVNKFLTMARQGV